MKKVFIKVIVIFFILTVAIITFLSEVKITDLKAYKGTLNLNKWNFEKQGIVNLNGQWEIYDNKLLEPKELSSEKPDGYFNIPGSLKKELNGRTTGYMTLRLKIYSKNEIVYGLRISGLLSASKVWVNGILQGQVGKVGTSFQDERAIYLPVYSYFPAESGLIDIVIETSNFRDVFPVIKSMEFGTKSQIMNKFLLSIFIDSIIIGGLLIIELLFLFLYKRRRENKAFLYFSILCLFIQLRCLFLNERIIVHIFPNMPYELLSKTAALTYYLWIPMYVIFLKEQFTHLSEKIVFVSSAFGAAFGIICLITNNVFYDRLAFSGQVILFIILLMILRFLSEKVKLKEKNSLISLIAYIILIVTAVNDILVNNGVSYGKYLFQIGMFAFAVLETYILSVKYSDEINKSQELEVKNRIIYEKSIRDSLTGLYNRNYIEKILDDMMDNYLNNNKKFSVIMFDIDHFKFINDSYGHLYGDKVIIKVAELIKENLRYMDYVGRYGGEEFIVLLSNTDLQKAFEIADRIRYTIEDFDWERKSKITISGGVYENISDKKTEAIENADKLLYLAKERGRNQVCSLFERTPGL